ncbi:MAG: type II toxin-antitoxin system RelE/ParE family toxin [Gammaproteobacteria bacterium]|nr:type II toxin-antitoxin system RelE/ParE family toxin [Gammaproteobacteria bacterium]
MANTLRIRRAAKRKLQSLPARDRYRITDAIAMLGNNPDDDSLDNRQLSGSELWRPRIGRWRVIYDRSDELRIISVEKIGQRGDIYK